MNSRRHDGYIYKAVPDISFNIGRMQSTVLNESEVRYAVVCDPILNMICDCFSLTMKLEESVKNSHDSCEPEDNKDDCVDGLQDLMSDGEVKDADEDDH